MALAHYDRDASAMTVRRLVLGIPFALLLLASVAWFWLLHTQSGARWIWARVEAATGGALAADDISGAIGSGLSARGVRYLSDGVEVSIAEASLSADVDLLPLRVTVLPAQVSELRIYLGGDEAPSSELDLKETFSNLRLPLEIVFTDVILDQGQLEGVGDDLLIAVDSLRLSGSWEDAWRLDEFSIVSEDLSLRGSGSFELHGDYELYLDAVVGISGEVTGLDGGLSLEATLQGPLDNLTGQGLIADPRTFWHSRVTGLTTDPRWELRVEMPGFELPADVGAIPPVELVARASGAGSMFLLDGEFGFADTNMLVRLTAEVDMVAETVAGNVEWDHAHWPIGDPQPQVNSRNGALSVSGTLDAWRVAGTIELAVPELPPGTLTVDGGGDRASADVQILEGSVLGGAVSGHARYSWGDGGAYSAELRLDAIRTNTVFPDWPALLSGTLDLEGQPDPFRLTAELREINGEFFARRLEANGRIEISDDTVAVTDFRVQHGDAYATVDGELFGPDGLRFDARISELGQYATAAYGSLAATGTVSLYPGAQFLRVDARSDVLHVSGVNVSGLQVVDHGTGTAVLGASVTADSLTVGDVDMGRVLVDWNLDRELQRVTIETDSEAGKAALTLAGRLDDWDSPSSWVGELERFGFETDKVAAALDAPATVRAGADSGEVEAFCLTGTRGAQICSAFSWVRGVGANIRSDLSSVPLDTVNLFVDTGLDFEQVASGSFRWRSNPNETSSGRGEISMTAGKITSRDEADLFIETGAATLGFDIDEDSLRSGVLDIPLPGLGQVAAEFELLDVTDDESADLHGMLDLDIDDIGLLVALFPVVDDASGVLRADLDFGGTAGAPLVSGDFRLERGSVSYLPVGLQIDDIELQSELQADGEIELTGSFRAGEGVATIRTRADHATTAATGLELTLRGSQLRIIDVPDVSAVADADLQVNFNGKSLDMNGNITIPSARVRPANLGAARVFESEDVVIVAGELPEDPDSAIAASDIDFAGSVEVVLGDDVAVDLEVTEVDVTGGTVFTWTGDPVPNGIGRYEVDGDVLVFGQRLEITEGSVRFEDDPADDPYIRVRAEREIFGNTQVRRAGVLVAGRASRLTIEPYTNPITTEERALTLLVTGSDFDYERGVGAIDFGTYIAPRVFVSYGIGLFDTENVIRVRYDLKRGFGVTGTSGASESGIDLSYQFEN